MKIFASVIVHYTKLIGQVLLGEFIFKLLGSVNLCKS